MLGGSYVIRRVGVDCVGFCYKFCLLLRVIIGLGNR